MTPTPVSAKGLALALFSVAMLSAAQPCAAEEQPPKIVRLYNAGPAEQEINAHTASLASCCRAQRSRGGRGRRTSIVHRRVHS